MSRFQPRVTHNIKDQEDLKLNGKKRKSIDVIPDMTEMWELNGTGLKLAIHWVITNMLAMNEK